MTYSCKILTTLAIIKIIVAHHEQKDIDIKSSSDDSKSTFLENIMIHVNTYLDNSKEI